MLMGFLAASNRFHQLLMRAAQWCQNEWDVVIKLSTLAMQVQSAVDINQPLFQPAPPEIVFHSYKPFHQYEAQLRLRNNDEVLSN